MTTSTRPMEAAATASAPAPGPEGVFPTGVVQRLIGRPAVTWTAEDLVRLVDERGIRLVSLVHVGGDGALKVLDFAPRSRAHLRDVLDGGERADGSSLFPGSGIPAGRSDVVLRPRLATAFLDPFSPLPTLALLCGHEDAAGAPLPQSPDTIVRSAARRLQQTCGVDLWALGEVELFLGRSPRADDLPGASDRGYHATSPFALGEALRRRALVLLADIGIAVKYGHSEVGRIEPAEAGELLWEQHEIELALAPLPEAADAVVLARWVLSNLAHREGMRVSFEPMLRRGHAGTGLHFHFSPVARAEHDVVRRVDGSLTDPARWLIAGLVEAGGALMAFGNRSADSFVRLTQAKEAPSAIVWGEADRTALVRLPIVARTEHGRTVAPPTVEFRLPDGSAHPHLLLAGVAQAMTQARSAPGLDAILQRTAASGGPVQPGGTVPVARSFREVGEALAARRDTFAAGDVFPATLLSQWIGRLSASSTP
ncbi:MAG: glutamine synthetase [bacterium]